MTPLIIVTVGILPLLWVSAINNVFKSLNELIIFLTHIPNGCLKIVLFGTVLTSMSHRSANRISKPFFMQIIIFWTVFQQTMWFYVTMMSCLESSLTFNIFQYISVLHVFSQLPLYFPWRFNRNQIRAAPTNTSHQKPRIILTIPRYSSLSPLNIPSLT